MTWKFSPQTPGGELCLELARPGAAADSDPARRTEALYETLSRAIWRYLVLTGAAEGDAEEYVQEAFLRLFRYLKSGGRVEHPRRWLLTAAHRVRLDECEKQLRRPAGAEDALEALAADSRPDPEQALLAGERRRQLDSALGRLTVRQSEYLNLRAEGLRLKDIARLYGVTVQSVAEACTRGLERLENLPCD
jgi:RNA polymerase sigma-70 factor (ECF subfamily)